MIIAVKQNSLGHLELEPVREEDRQIVRISNRYDGTCDVYMQDELEIYQFLGRFSDECVEEVKAGYPVRVDLDGWEYRHMVGGQCD